MKYITIAFAGALTALISIPVFAGNVSLPNGPYLIADGSATYEASPDTVTLQFSIFKKETTTAAASDALDSKTAAVFKVLHDLGIPDKDIRASSVSVSAQYNYDNGKQTYAGREVLRDFKVTLENLALYSKLIKSLLKVNIDTISDITFDTTRRSEYERKALRKAIDNAHEHALDMAKQVGAKLGVAYALASRSHRSYLAQGFPLQGNNLMADLAPTVTVTAQTMSPNYIVPKSITISYDVTVIYSMSY